MTRVPDETVGSADKPKGRKNAAKKKARPARSAIKPAARAVKEKTVRGRFSFPASDYDLIAELKSVSKKNGRQVKKNELLRAGLRALRAMHEEEFVAAVAVFKSAKPSRRAKTDDD